MEQVLSEMQAIEKRENRVAIKISGKDAVHLLNDVVTGHIPAEPGPARWWALLTPQGKILAEGLAAYTEDTLWLDVDESVRADFLKRMRMYTLRADAKFADLSESHAVGWSETPVADAICAADGRGAPLGYRIIAPEDETSGWRDNDAFTARRIAFGLCELGPDFAADTTFPHDIGMDLLDGIDFEKGCYVGQEVVSRMKHIGTAKRRPVIVTGNELTAGAAIMVGTRPAGTLGAVKDGRGVGIVRVDRISGPEAASVNGHAVRLALPSWASYRFGDSGGGDSD